MCRGREGWVGQERGQAVRGRGTKETCHCIAVIVVTIVVVAVVIVIAVVSRHCCHCCCCRRIHLVLWCTWGCWTEGECRGRSSSITWGAAAVVGVQGHWTRGKHWWVV